MFGYVEQPCYSILKLSELKRRKGELLPSFWPQSPHSHSAPSSYGGGGGRILLFVLFYSRSTDKNLRGAGHQKGVYKGKVCGREALMTSGNEVLLRSMWLSPEGVHSERVDQPHSAGDTPD